MKQDCIKAVIATLGRKPTERELNEIETRTRAQYSQMMKRDPDGFMRASPEDRAMLAASKAAEDLQRESRMLAMRKVRNAGIEIANRQYINGRHSEASAALADMIANDYTGKSGIQSVESKANAISKIAFSQMIDELYATQPKVLGLFENENGVKEIIKELHGEPSGNPLAERLARKFHETTERLRQQFNMAGGDIGKLEDWALPHHHSQAKVSRAGVEKWVAFVKPLLNRSRYIDENGAPMSEAEINRFLSEAYETISSDGISKWSPDAPVAGTGARANRGSESRAIHFSDSDAYTKYWHEFGDKGLFDIITGHIQNISKDIALVETFGSNPDYAIQKLLREAEFLETKAGKTPDDARNRARRTEEIYDHIAGNNPGPASQGLANVMRGLRSAQSGAKLLSAVITSVTDEGTMWLTAGMNNLGYSKILKRELSLLNPANAGHRAEARRLGLGIETILGSLNHYGVDLVGSDADWHGKFAAGSNKLTTALIRASGLNAVTDARRQAFGVEMLHDIAVKTRAGFDQLSPDDAKRFSGYGVQPKHWDVWQMTKPDELGQIGAEVLSPASIYKLTDEELRATADKYKTTPRRLRNDAAVMLNGIANDQSLMAVIEPGARERSWMYGKSQAGTVKGEFARSFWTFKSFGVSMVMRHLQRGLAQEGNASKAAYLSKLIGATTVLGGLALQLGEIASGKDPRDMEDPKFWGAAFVKGGSFGIYGDFLYGQTTRYDQSVPEVVLGPVGSLIFGPINMIGKAKDAALKGESPQLGGDFARWVKGNTPGMSMWYAKAAIDHMIWHDLMEMASPGYLSRMRQRTRREYNQDWYWQPGENMPERLPDLTAIAGGSK